MLLVKRPLKWITRLTIPVVEILIGFNVVLCHSQDNNPKLVNPKWWTLQQENTTVSHVTLIKSKFHVFIPLILQRRPHKTAQNAFDYFHKRFLSAISAFCLGPKVMHNENLIYGNILYMPYILPVYMSITARSFGKFATHRQWVSILKSELWALIPIFMSPATINLSAFC